MSSRQIKVSPELIELLKTKQKDYAESQNDKSAAILASELSLIINEVVSDDPQLDNLTSPQVKLLGIINGYLQHKKEI
jgi:hypothetical protein